MKINLRLLHRLYLPLTSNIASHYSRKPSPGKSAQSAQKHLRSNIANSIRADLAIENKNPQSRTKLSYSLPIVLVTHWRADLIKLYIAQDQNIARSRDVYTKFVIWNEWIDELLVLVFHRVFVTKTQQNIVYFEWNMIYKCKGDIGDRSFRSFCPR